MTRREDDQDAVEEKESNKTTRMRKTMTRRRIITSCGNERRPARRGEVKGKGVDICEDAPPF